MQMELLYNKIFVNYLNSPTQQHSSYFAMIIISHFYSVFTNYLSTFRVEMQLICTSYFQSKQARRYEIPIFTLFAMKHSILQQQGLGCDCLFYRFSMLEIISMVIFYVARRFQVISPLLSGNNPNHAVIFSFCHFILSRLLPLILLVFWYRTTTINLHNTHFFSLFGQ